MNKNIKKIMVIFFSFIILGYTVFASTKTYEREEVDNYGVDNYKVTSSNKNNVLNTPYVDASEKVYDFAELLDEEEEKNLASLIEDFIEEHDMDMAIVTTNDTDSRNSTEYADDFFDYNDFGLNDNLDGILFLIDMDNRVMWISTHGEAIRMYSDSRIDSILDSTYSYISKQDYYNCAKAFVNRASSYARQGVPHENIYSHIDNKTGDIVYEKHVEILPVLLFGVMGAGIITLVFILVGNSKHKVIRKATQAKQYLVKDSVVLNRKEDRFISTHTSKVYDPPSDSSSGGGSSSHSSSSGSFHGGGGRSF